MSQRNVTTKGFGMNLVEYLVGMFRGSKVNGQIEEVKEAGRNDARLVVTAYVDAFEEEAGRLLFERRERFAGRVIDVEPVPVEDFADWTRPQLMAEAKRRGIGFDRSATKDELIGSLS